MDTDKLIKALAADGRPPVMPMGRAWTIAAIASSIIAALVFFLLIGPRPDIADAATTVRFLFKFVVTAALFATAFTVLTSLGRPEAWPRAVLPLLLVAPAFLVVAVGAEIAAVPSNEIVARWVGSNSAICMTFIPMIGVGPLAVLLLAMRHGASTRPSLTGAVAGLVAGGLAATFYAAHCTDDSPLFVATWYPMAIGILAILGAIAGKAFIRW